MRIYLPLTADDLPAVQERRPRTELAAGRVAWAVTAEARADRADADEEDLEYDALQDAVHVAFGGAEPSEKVLVIAADIVEQDAEPWTEEGGAFGIRLRRATAATIASFHVTELDAAAAEADDTDPALLWFDASEGPDALTFLAAAGTD